VIRPLSRKSRFQRVRETVSDSLEMPSGIKSGLPEVGADKAVKTSLIAAGGLAAITAASAGVSSLRRQREGARNGA
jgi:hypothetical protein